MTFIISLARRSILFALLAIVVAGCEPVSNLSSGVGSATKDLADKVTGNEPAEQDDDAAEEQATSQSASGKIGTAEPDPDEESEEEESADEAEPEAETNDVAAEPRSGRFELVFEMSHQSCSSCGIWFDSAELVIVHSEGRFSARQSGSLLIKEAPYHQGRFKADISSIPSSSSIESATLHMLLNRHEGISNDDFTSSIAVYGYIDGSKEYVREITAEDDIKGRGYSKANPNVPIDFTRYARRL